MSFDNQIGNLVVTLAVALGEGKPRRYSLVTLLFYAPIIELLPGDPG